MREGSGMALTQIGVVGSGMIMEDQNGAGARATGPPWGARPGPHRGPGKCQSPETSGSVLVVASVSRTCPRDGSDLSAAGDGSERCAGRTSTARCIGTSPQAAL